MHGPVVNAISVLLFSLSALLLLGAAGYWAKLARHREAPTERPAIPVHAFRTAAGVTAVALVLLAAAMGWGALVAVPWGG